MQLPHQILLPKAPVVAFFGGSNAALGRAFEATTARRALSRVAVRAWGEFIPEARARQLLDVYPDLRNLLLDPISRRQLGPTPEPRVPPR